MADLKSLMGDDIFENLGRSLTLVAGLSPKFKNLLYGAAAFRAIPVVKSIYTSVKEASTDYKYTATIDSDDSLYYTLNEILFSEVGYDGFPDVSAGVSISNSPSGPKADITMGVAKSGVFELKIAGHSVQVRATTLEDKRRRGSDNSATAPDGSPSMLESGNGSSKGPAILHVDTTTAKARSEVLEFLASNVEIFTRPPRKYLSTSWSEFRSVGILPKRTLDSVILKDGQAERIKNNINSFLDNKESYENMGVPWRHGILFEGPPGTGKSSLALAIAHEFNMNIYVVNISSIEDDNALQELIGSVSEKSIILLEDIDTNLVVKNRKDSAKDGPRGVTLSGILNVLDGPMAPSGTITVLTTNDADSIDPAVLRPGRVDLRERVDYIDNAQLIRMCEKLLGFVPADLPVVCEDDMISPADVVDSLKRHITDMEHAAVDLVASLTLKLKERTSVNA